MIHHILRTGLIMALITASGYAQTDPTCQNMVGSWDNQLGSTLEITQIDNTSGRIVGTYRSPSGTSGQTFDLIGWVNSQPPSGGHNVPVISFSVQWGQYGSITAWTGYCEILNDVPTITTLWHLVRSNSDFSWDHIITNSDTFTPVP